MQSYLRTSILASCISLSITFTSTSQAHVKDACQSYINARLKIYRCKAIPRNFNCSPLHPALPHSPPDALRNTSSQPGSKIQMEMKFAILSRLEIYRCKVIPRDFNFSSFHPCLASQPAPCPAEHLVTARFKDTGGDVDAYLPIY